MEHSDLGFDPLEFAIQYSDEQRTKYSDLIGDNPETARDVARYLETRPYLSGIDEAENPIICGPDGTPIDQIYDVTPIYKPLIEFSFMDLARKLAEARIAQDKTSALDIEDAIIKKLENLKRSTKPFNKDTRYRMPRAHVGGEPNNSQLNEDHLYMMLGLILKKADKLQEDIKREAITNTESNEFNQEPTVGDLEDLANQAYLDLEDAIISRSLLGGRITIEEYGNLIRDYVNLSLKAIRAKHDDHTSPEYRYDIKALWESVDHLESIIVNHSESDTSRAPTTNGIPATEKHTEIIPVIKQDKTRSRPLKHTDRKQTFSALYISTREKAREYFHDPDKGFRRRVVRDIGGIAILAASIYGISRGLGGLQPHVNHIHPSHIKPPVKPPSHHPSQPIRPKPPINKVDTHQLTWNLAEEHYPQNPTEAINNSLLKYNQRFGTTFHLLPFNGNIEIGEVIRGRIRIISPLEMYHLNSMLIELYP